MMRSFRPLRGAFCIFAGILSAMSFVLGQDGYMGMSELPASATSYLWSALAACFAWLLYQVFVKREIRLHWLTALFALVFGVCNAFGGVLFAYDSWDMLKSPIQLALVLLKSVGQSIPMAAAMSWLDAFLKSGKMQRPDGLKLPAFAEKHEILCLMAVMILCWSPYLIAFFPGTVCWDLGEMVAQFFGQTEMDTWHPVFTTWLIGGCVWIGRLFGSDNLGAALFTLVQTLALSYALAKSVQYLRKAGMNRMVQLCALAFFALLPIWGGYAQFISKDTLYTAAMLLFTLEVLSVLGSHTAATLTEGYPSVCPSGSQLPSEEGSRAAGCGLRLFLWGLLSCLLRSNGLYVVLPTAVILILFGAKGRIRWNACAGLCGAVLCAILFSSVLVPALGIRDETASGIYSVCFQQSARTLRDHADTVTPEEYAEIDLVLDAANLPDLYEPWISDPVKYTFRQYGQGAEAEKAALARYRQTWLSMFAKYPLTYAESFFAGNLSYYTFAPKLEGETYNNQAGNRLVFETYELGDSRGPDPRFLDTTQISALEPVRRLLAAFARGIRHIPLLSLLYACATYTWLLVGAGLSAARRNWKALIGFLPALLSLAVCMLSPVNDYFRYFLPVAAMAWPLIGFAAKHEGDG